nr:MAG TPA: Gas vesicle protein G [Caudoviricetes sp.]DAW49637.1 MAG TPA: Gas vesicle protein G [Caudoviricetes sp.]
MTLTYKKLKDYVLTSYDLSSLVSASHKCTAFYEAGEITKLEYRKLMKCIDRIVIKGCKCEKIGL